MATPATQVWAAIAAGGEYLVIRSLVPSFVWV
jgi:hypothetical protein